MQSTVQEESKSKIARKLWQPEAPNAFGASASVRDAIVPLFDIQTKFADQIWISLSISYSLIYTLPYFGRILVWVFWKITQKRIVQKVPMPRWHQRQYSSTSIFPVRFWRVNHRCKSLVAWNPNLIWNILWDEEWSWGSRKSSVPPSKLEVPWRRSPKTGIRMKHRFGILATPAVIWYAFWPSWWRFLDCQGGTSIDATDVVLTSRATIRKKLFSASNPECQKTNYCQVLCCSDKRYGSRKNLGGRFATPHPPAQLGLTVAYCSVKLTTVGMC